MSVTAILSAYRRPQNLQLQVEAIRPQVDHIILYKNYHPDFTITDIHCYQMGIDTIIKSGYNYKYHGRFAIALLATTEYVFILDDDTIPGSKYVQNCLTYHQPDMIFGTVGLKFKRNFVDYTDHIRIGWPNNDWITQVDFVGQSWFMPYHFLRYFWDERPVSLETGEDMHFAYYLQRRGIRCFVPPQEGETCGSILGSSLGVDHTTPSNEAHPDHYRFRDERNRVLQSYIARGWKLINS